MNLTLPRLSFFPSESAYRTIYILLLSSLLLPGVCLGIDEREPNNSFTDANALDLSEPKRITGNIFENGDEDFFSFQATAGQRLYAAVMSSSSANASTDSTLTILDTDGTTVIEEDLNDGTFGPQSSSVAGLTIPANGIYFVGVKHSSPTSQLRPYDLYLTLQPNTLASEIEPNDATGNATSLEGTTHMTGTVSPAGDFDFYSINLNAGDTLFVSLDLDPERDGITFNGQVLLIRGSDILIANDTNTVSPNSEALFMTVRDAGVYHLAVSDSGGGGSPSHTYALGLAIFPEDNPLECTTISATSGLPLTIPSGPGIVENALQVSNAARIGSIRLDLDIAHSFFSDLDVTLRSPQGEEIGLFTDVGPVAAGAYQARFGVSDSAALPLGVSTQLDNGNWRTELSYRLAWLHGGDPNGEWRLIIRDDASGDAGELHGWSVTLCPQPSVCEDEYIPSVLFSVDFESGEAGFTHSGTQDEWQLGLPTLPPLDHCFSGSNCWKTDLDGSYNASTNQTLRSPAIDLSGATGPLVVSWAQKYSLESASFDSYSVRAQEIGNPLSEIPLFTWLDATMNISVGNPTVTITQSSAWGLHHADISPLAGMQVDLSFQLTSDTTVQLPGVAIDDITITECLIDQDGDAVPDRDESCPNDPNKTAAGICGCGVTETDSDGDGAFDCVDACPSNSVLVESSVCGCTTPVDSNGNGAFECQANAEVVAQLHVLQAALGKLKLPKTAKQVKSQKLLRKAFKAKLRELQEFTVAHQTSIQVTGGLSISKSLRSASMLTRKISKANPQTFNPSKTKLKRLIKKFLAAVGG